MPPVKKMVNELWIFIFPSGYDRAGMAPFPSDLVADISESDFDMLVADLVEARNRGKKKKEAETPPTCLERVVDMNSMCQFAGTVLKGKNMVVRIFLLLFLVPVIIVHWVVYFAIAIPGMLFVYLPSLLLKKRKMLAALRTVVEQHNQDSTKSWGGRLSLYHADHSADHATNDPDEWAFDINGVPFLCTQMDEQTQWTSANWPPDGVWIVLSQMDHLQRQPFDPNAATPAAPVPFQMHPKDVEVYKELMKTNKQTTHLLEAVMKRWQREIGEWKKKQKKKIVPSKDNPE
jgi:hypothetical protein